MASHYAGASDQEFLEMSMPVRRWRLLTIMLTALSLGPALGHLHELPAKMTYQGALWLKSFANFTRNLRHSRCRLRGWRGCRDGGARDDGVATTTSLCMDDRRSSVSDLFACGILNLARASERNDCGALDQDSTVKLRRVAQSMGIHARDPGCAPVQSARRSCRLDSHRNVAH